MDPIVGEDDSRSMRFPRPIWLFAGTAALVLIGLGLVLGVPVYRQRMAIQEIKRFSGSVQYFQHRPEWLTRLIGEEWMEWINEPEHVVFWPDGPTLSRRSRFGGMVVGSEPLINDQRLKCVLGLPHLKSLDLAFSNTGDAGLEYVSRLQHLEFLRLEGTDVSDAGIAILLRMKSLKTLQVEHTKITATGVRKLAKALPGCDVRTSPGTELW